MFSTRCGQLTIYLSDSKTVIIELVLCGNDNIDNFTVMVYLCIFSSASATCWRGLRT